MAPQMPLVSRNDDEADTEADADADADAQAESQDSQLLTLHMHMLLARGATAGNRSSVPVQPRRHDRLVWNGASMQPLNSSHRHTRKDQYAHAQSRLPQSGHSQAFSALRLTNRPNCITSKPTLNAAQGESKQPATRLAQRQDRSKPDPTAAATSKAEALVSVQARTTDASIPRRASSQSTTSTTSPGAAAVSVLPPTTNDRAPRSLTAPDAAPAPGSNPASPPWPLGDAGHGSPYLDYTKRVQGHLTFSQASAEQEPSDKMEPSQSPTQSNDGRSYEQYLARGDDLIPSDPLDLADLSRRSSSPNSHNDLATLHDDDTGAVNFDFSALARQESQISYATSLEPDRLQQASPGLFARYPETPAPPRNPFSESRASLMRGSQMFRQTQHSSAYKVFSPTSSRPSPDNIPQLNSISPNPVASSPLKRISLDHSPTLDAPSSLPPSPPRRDLSSQPTDKDLGHDYVPSKKPLTFPSLPRPPIERYETRHKSQERRESSFYQAGTSSATDDDLSDVDERRRRRAMRRKAAEAKRLRSISFERHRSSAPDDVIVPSTNSKKLPGPAARQYLDQCAGNTARDSQNAIEDTQDAVEDSEDDIVRLSSGDREDEDPVEQSGNPSSNEAVVPNTNPSPSTSCPEPMRSTAQALSGSLGHQEHIPESSPTTLRTPTHFDDMLPSTEEAQKLGLYGKASAGNAPDRLLGGVGFVELEDRPRLAVPTEEPNSSGRLQAEAYVNEQEVNNANAENACSPVVDRGSARNPVRSSPTDPASSTRAKSRGTNSRPNSRAASRSSSTQHVDSSSPLSGLGTTPELSNRTTPLTGESTRQKSSISSKNISESSHDVAKAHRQKNSGTTAKKGTKSSRAVTRKARSSFAAGIPTSPDILARSPPTSTSAFEQTTRSSILGRASAKRPPAPRETSRGGAKVFAHMAFAISFQGKQPGEKETHHKARIAQSTQIANKIKQAGGKVLTTGFDELFDVSPVKNADRDAAPSTPQPDEDIKLNASSKETGFTALIADGHSRKVKYMQALALGLPCLHERWITTCVEKQELVDWSDYLLCAGNSSFLGEAIRSRNLTYYDAASAKLCEVVQDRPRLLDRSRILLILSRADESKKMAYVFLARVLGASLSRVYSLEEARKQLKAREDAANPFDWVYVDEKLAGKADLFNNISACSSSSGAAGKKRKRRSELAPMGPPPKKIRTLSDELVVQSLILGRLMGEDEMTA